MKFKIGLLIYFGASIFHAGKVCSQINLVPNPSFEVYDTCPNDSLDGSIQFAIPWFDPNIQIHSTDYFNNCNLDTASLNCPQNFIGYQLAHSGNGYAGFTTGTIQPANNLREYLEVELIDSLLQGKKYCVSFFVSLGDQSQTATDGIGVFFSQNIISSNSTCCGLLAFSP